MAARAAPAPPPPLEPRGGCWAGLGGAAPGPCGARAARGRAGAVRSALSAGAPLGAAAVAAAARARRRGAGAGRPTIVPLKQVQPLSPPAPPTPRGRGGREGGRGASARPPLCVGEAPSPLVCARVSRSRCRPPPPPFLLISARVNWLPPRLVSRWKSVGRETEARGGAAPEAARGAGGGPRSAVRRGKATG